MNVKELILGNPYGYRLFQKMNGANKMRRILSSEYIKAKSTDYVLDVACGTADIRPFLNECNYTGIDISEEYISYDRKVYLDSDFICKDLNQYIGETEQKYDIIILIGVLHHLTDEEVRECLKKLPLILHTKGRIVTMDGAYVNGLSPFERMLLSADRGKYVRKIGHWKRIFDEVMPDAEYEIRKDLLYLPYNQVLFTWEKPDSGESEEK